MLSKIQSIIGIILFFSLSKSCISDYRKGGDNKAIANYEKMIFDNSIAMAELSSEYKEVTVKVMKVPIKTYEFRYKFNVNNNKYEGTESFSQLPTTNSIKVYYLKTDPYFNCTNPEGNLKAEKEKNASKSSLYWGIGWGVLCLLLVLSFIQELKEKKIVVESQAVA